MGDHVDVRVPGVCKDLKGPFFKPCRAHFRHTLESLEGPVPEDAPSMEKSELFVKPSVAQEKPRKHYNSIEQGCESRPDVGLESKLPVASWLSPLGTGVSDSELVRLLGGFDGAEFVKDLAEGLTQEMIILPCVELPCLGQAHLIIPFHCEEHEFQRG